jgi:membrane protein
MGDQGRRRWRGIVDVAKEVSRRSKADGLPDVAAGLAFWTFLSLLPTLVALVSLIGAMERVIGEERADELRQEILDRLDEVLAAGKLRSVRETVEDIITNPREGLAVIGLVVALWSMSKGFASLSRTLAVVHGCPERRFGLRGRAVGLALGAGTIVLLTVIVAQMALGPLFGLGDGEAWLVEVWGVVRAPVFTMLLLAWLTVLLKVGPGIDRSLRECLPGAAAATAGVGLTAFGAVALLRVGLLDTNPIYGALGGLILFLTFLYTVARIILTGGELNDVRFRRVEAEEPAPVIDRPPTEPTPAATLSAVGLIVAALLRRR